MEKSELKSTIEKIKDLQAMEKELKKELASLQNEIKDEMDNLGVEQLDVDQYTVRYKEVTSNRFDTTGFKKAHKHMYEAFLKPSVSKRFTIN